MDGEASLAIFGWTRSGQTPRPRTLLVLMALVGAVLPGAASAQYTESFQSWSATSAGSWQTQDLSGAPFNARVFGGQ